MKPVERCGAQKEADILSILRELDEKRTGQKTPEPMSVPDPRELLDSLKKKEGFIRLLDGKMQRQYTDMLIELEDIIKMTS